MPHSTKQGFYPEHLLFHIRDLVVNIDTETLSEHALLPRISPIQSFFRKYNIIPFDSYLRFNIAFTVIFTVYNILLTNTNKKTNIYTLQMTLTYEYIYYANKLIL